MIISNKLEVKFENYKSIIYIYDKKKKKKTRF